MSDNYESKFGIFQHQLHGDTKPMSSVAFHSCEDMISASLLAESMRVYDRKKIKDIFGLSYLEYMALPVSISSLMRDICEEILSVKAKQVDNADDMLKKAMAGVTPKYR